MWKYPRGPLRLSMTSDSWARRLVMEGLIGPRLRPRSGIASGSPFELCLMMMPVITRIRGTRLGFQLSIHVDDVMASAQGERHESVRKVAEAAKAIKDTVEARGVAVEDAKGFCLAGQQREHGRRWGPRGALAKSVKRLGVDHWRGRRSVSQTGPVLKGMLMRETEGWQAHKVQERDRESCPIPHTVRSSLRPRSKSSRSASAMGCCGGAQAKRHTKGPTGAGDGSRARPRPRGSGQGHFSDGPGKCGSAQQEGKLAVQ